VNRELNGYHIMTETCLGYKNVEFIAKVSNVIVSLLISSLDARFRKAPHYFRSRVYSSMELIPQAPRPH
jgi:hypothetical protein